MDLKVNIRHLWLSIYKALFYFSDEEGENENVEMDSEDEEDDVFISNGNVQDPRAGNVNDVVLSQLNPDFEVLSEYLYKIGSSKEILNKRRDLLYELTKQFKGNY